jgi:ribosomal protein S18 acetylase RimI-like enzyme
MAALAQHPPAPVLVDLRQLRAEHLDGLLAEEVEAWESRLTWDFRPSADLVRRFIRMQALNGYALMAGNRAVGYCYSVCEDRKGLIGDIFVSPQFRGDGENEEVLIAAVLRSLWATPGVHRVESQLIMLSDAGKRRLPLPAYMRTRTRNFMVAGVGIVPTLAPATSPRLLFEPWHERDQEQAARLIVRAYENHVDAEINDQYRSVSGARRFLNNIVQYPGCGSFFQPGSFVAQDAVTGKLIGLSLASLVAFDVGHITQICVDPEWAGRKVGFELIRRSLDALARNGSRRVSLTVTASNASAVKLYEGLGFRTATTFDAIVWEGLR